MKTDIELLKKLYADGYSLNSLQKILGVHRSTLSGYLKKNDVKVKYHEKLETLNERYFQNIDDQEKAYFLGFIFADGSVNARGNNLTVDLSAKDIEILNRFSDLLYRKNYVISYNRYGREYCKLNVNSIPLCNDLLTHNVTSNKTFTIKYPIIDPGVENHFIRGLIDGDGCICLPTSNRNSPSVSLICTRDIADYLQKKFSEDLKIKSYIYKSKNYDPNTICNFVVKNYHQVKILLDWLYKDSNIYLQRKYNLYQEFLKKYNNLRDQNK